MKFAPIVPFPVLPHIADSDYHMILAPQCAYEAYGSFYYKAEGHKILDNGVAEGKSVSTTELLGWADALHVDEVIAPDVMHDMQETIYLLQAFMRQCDGAVNVMAVLQARNPDQFQKILDTALELGVAAVALPKLLTKHLGEDARIQAAEAIRVLSPDIPIHCLGSSTWLQEAKYLAAQGIVRGIDTAAPAVLGLEGMSIEDPYKWEVSHSAILGYWNMKLTHQMEVNLAEYRHWCEDTPVASTPSSEV